MRLTFSVKLGAWLLIGLNLLMALGSVWVFSRMSPAIEIIIDRNERSLHSCEEMLSSLALVNENSNNADLRAVFTGALERAKNNITEPDEPAALAAIQKNFAGAFENDYESRGLTVASILELGKINRDAMIAADRKAKQIGNAGAWSVVFMAAAVFFSGIIYLRGLSKDLLTPIEEIYSVITAFKKGETMRRCHSASQTRDIRSVFNALNELLDNYKIR